MSYHASPQQWHQDDGRGGQQGFYGGMQPQDILGQQQLYDPQAHYDQQGQYKQQEKQHEGAGREPGSRRRVGIGLWMLGLAITATALCVAGFVVVVLLAGTRPLDSWKPASPTVILSILSHTITPLLIYILSSAVVVVWWRECRKGTELQRIHHIWFVMRGLLFRPDLWARTIFSSWAVGKLFVGYLLVTAASLVVGPLLQRAVQAQGVTDISSNSTLGFDVLDSIPDGLTGTTLSTGPVNSTLAEVQVTFALTAAAAQTWNNETIYTKNETGYSCEGTCRGAAEATDISVDCVQTQRQLKLSTPDPSNTQLIFGISGSLATDSSGIPYLAMKFTYIASTDPTSCVGVIVEDACAVYAARTRFPIVVTGRTVTVPKRAVADWTGRGERIAHKGDSLSLPPETPAGPLRGLLYPLGIYFDSYFYLGGKTYGISTDTLFRYAVPTSNRPICYMTWSPPTDLVLNFFSETLLRLSMDGNKYSRNNSVAPIDPPRQTIAVERMETKAITVIDISWMIGALVLALVALLASVFLLWGAWTFNREISLSPVECAQVIPEHLRGCDATADELVELMKNEKITYNPAKR